LTRILNNQQVITDNELIVDKFVIINKDPYVKESSEKTHFWFIITEKVRPKGNPQI
jgi:hypothetical protein